MAYRYFYDCEFIEDGRTVDLVSIGMVDEFGREFYAVSTEFDDSKAVPWVRRNVLDKLPSPANPAWRSRERIRDDLYDFLVEPIRGRPGEAIELWAWYAAYQAQRSSCSPRPLIGSTRNAYRSSRMRSRERQAGSAGDGNLSSTLRRTQGTALVSSNSVDTA